MEIAIILLLVLMVLAVGFLIFKRTASDGSYSMMMDRIDSEHAAALQYEREEKLRLEDQLNDLRRALEDERSRNSAAEAMLTAQRERLKEQEQYVLDLKQKLTLEFENIAGKLLDEKSARFTLQTRENMEVILNPLKQNIKAFEEKVDKVYKVESDERNRLEGVLKEMMQQSKQIQEDANNLTRALKGDNKKQGNWGEVVLERVLEQSGLTKGREYRVQASHTDGLGARFQPDVIIDLPDGKNLVIDAKISLLAYEQFVNAETDEERLSHFKQHSGSIRAHIDGLSTKQYHTLYEINSPDFVLLFMPLESSFSITVQSDHEIFSYAWNKKVVIVSPTTLLATLRTIASIWKIDRQNKNVFAIANEAGLLYDKFVGFLEDLEKVGKNLTAAQKAHEDAFKKLQTGSGNVIGKIEKIKILGAKANKQIGTRFIDQEED